MLDLPKTQRGVDSVFIMVDQFLKIAHYIVCMTVHASNITNLYFKELVHLWSVKDRNLILGYQVHELFLKIPMEEDQDGAAFKHYLPTSN